MCEVLSYLLFSIKIALFHIQGEANHACVHSFLV